MKGNIPENRFKINQQVFIGRTEWGSKEEICPDCGGDKVWTVITKTFTIEVPCETCNRGYIAHGTIKDYDFAPVVGRYTIGSIRMDTNDAKDLYTYMCRETGIGSGSVYRESDMFSDESSAWEHAVKITEQTKAEKEREKQEKSAKGKRLNRRFTPEEKEIAILRERVKELEAMIS
jgi:hypothetical protein